MIKRPFFSYYGSKFRVAPVYPSPQNEIIVEPFAGAAGYSCRHHQKKVLLYDKDPVIVGVWNYLIAATESEILKLPDITDSVDLFPRLPQEARWLIGFWLNKSCAHPCKSPSAWMRSHPGQSTYWGWQVRESIASQLRYIRHWKCAESSYEEICKPLATYFVDPPYLARGSHYRYGSKGIDYARLGDWCAGLPGQAIVCENAGETWLPFTPICVTNGAKYKTIEAAWVKTA